MDKKDHDSFAWIRVPEKGLTDVYSDDSMTTSPSSKSSLSWPESEWGRTRKLRKDKMQLKLEAVESALLGMIGSVAASVCEKMMEWKLTEKARAGDEKCKSIENSFVEEILVRMAKWVRSVDGEPCCLICGKAVTQGHFELSEHLKRIGEDAIGTCMSGNALTTRRLNGEECEGVSIKRKLYDFWGDRLENLIKAARGIHLRKGVFWNGKHKLTRG